jgi:ribonuclease P protein component
MREADVPAEQQKAQEAPRFPGPDAFPRRSGRAQGPAPARPHAALGLIRRVRDRATFSALAGAERLVRRPVTVRFIRGEDAAPPRVAYAVGAAGGAVARNRVRRRLRAAVARAEDGLVPGGAYLVSAGQEALTMPFSELADTVLELVEAAGEHG